ncbi:carboxymuconolactone decarboxylase family protein [Larkinella terrae]|uniref:Carboxymuconolactone decarboxylase family protein n=1 Tax=Larkinella terrae TaxID=2025311 RepID=A0A7K0ESP9_9BACT|nr:carboxymuconolactone decarboxylase family protein [Larkinella terrae]MRS64844.1 carboxymuconolactone decarboxylase family protein [Larkinella terrae]
MQKRIRVKEVNPAAYRAMLAIDQYVQQTDLSQTVKDLIKIRSSQINRCAYCIDLHTREARQHGETEQRIYALTAWRDTPFFTDAERAVLALTEAVTRIASQTVPDEVYNEVALHFGDSQIADLILAISVINSWNRIGVCTLMSPA